MENNQGKLVVILDALRLGNITGHEASQAVRLLWEALREGKLTDRETYTAVHQFGKQNFQMARPDVERLLESNNPSLRMIALMVLTRFWQIAEHWQTAKDVLEHDQDDDCRIYAATDLATLRRDTGDEKTLKVLARVVSNQHEDQIVRESAYAGMKEVLHYDPREQSKLSSKDMDLEKGVDWELVNKYL